MKTEQNHNIEIKILSEPINKHEALSFIECTENGGSNIFIGSVRSENFSKKVIAVSYDAFIPLTKKILLQIARETIDKYKKDNDKNIKVYIAHRIGKLLVGDPSVIIAVSTKHRNESYQISREIIERLKHEAPIWKKEHYQDGETQWLKGHSLCQH
jgi:molybdopterin synthase catalytic subunit